MAIFYRVINVVDNKIVRTFNNRYGGMGFMEYVRTFAKENGDTDLVKDITNIEQAINYIETYSDNLKIEIVEF